MSKNSLIIISGYPATGKTTLGRKLSTYLKIPFLGRDDIKESLFDSLGYDNREWSRKIGVASFELLWQLTESMLKVNSPIIIETYFNKQIAKEKILKLKDKYDFIPIEINCKAENSVRVKRYIERNESGNRHPGHVDHTNYKNINNQQEKKTTLNIGGKLFELDTTDFKSIDYNKLFITIKSSIKIKKHPLKV